MFKDLEYIFPVYAMGSIAELRTLIEKRLAEGIPMPPGEFYPEDLERLQDDQYLERVLAHCRQDLTRASKQLWLVLKWRSSVGARDINEGNLRMDYINTGTFFPRGRDMQGCRILVFKCGNYVRGKYDLEEVNRMLIYWLDRVEREESGKKVTLFFDLDGCTLSNFDVELVRRLIELFNYYPGFLSRIVVYQLPWLLTATFKIAKRLLPSEAVDIMKFATKDNVLKEIVNEDQALASWGGKDNYEFKFVPEKKVIKRVSFSTTIDRQASTSSTISTISTKSSEEFTMSFENPTNDANSEGDIVIIEPAEKIIFRNESEEIVGRINIKNLDDKYVAFKIRTTGPEKFWVRPSSGVIPPMKNEQIQVTILPGYQKTAPRERFLVMATPVNAIKANMEQTDLNEVWKRALNSDIEERRLKCQYIENIVTNNVVANGNTVNGIKDLTDISRKILHELKDEVNVLKIQVSQLKFFQYLSLVLGLTTVVLGYLIYKGVQDVILKEGSQVMREDL